MWPSSQGYVGYSTPSAAVAPDGTLHIFSDVASEALDPTYGPGNNWLQVAIQHSWSSDGAFSAPALHGSSAVVSAAWGLQPTALICSCMARNRCAGGATFRQDPKPLLVRGSFNWTLREIRSPAPTFTKKAGAGGGHTLWLSFAGDQLYTVDASGKRVYHADRWGIGAVTCELE